MKTLIRIILSLILMVGTWSASNATNDNIGDKSPVIRYYPNPVQKILTVEVQLDFANQYQGIEVKIVNLLGQEMIKPIAIDANGIMNEIRIDLTSVPSGVYFLEVYSTINGNTTKQTRKITRN